METIEANPQVIQKWAERTKCAMCRHQESEGHILPAKVFTPSVKWAFHYEDTHGFPHDGFTKVIWNSVYGLPINEVNIFGLTSEKEKNLVN